MSVSWKDQCAKWWTLGPCSVQPPPPLQAVAQWGVCWGKLTVRECLVASVWTRTDLFDDAAFRCGLAPQDLGVLLKALVAVHKGPRHDTCAPLTVQQALVVPLTYSRCMDTGHFMFDDECGAQALCELHKKWSPSRLYNHRLVSLQRYEPDLNRARLSDVLYKMRLVRQCYKPATLVVSLTVRTAQEFRRVKRGKRRLNSSCEVHLTDMALLTPSARSFATKADSRKVIVDVECHKNSRAKVVVDELSVGCMALIALCQGRFNEFHRLRRDHSVQYFKLAPLTLLEELGALYLNELFLIWVDNMVPFDMLVKYFQRHCRDIHVVLNATHHRNVPKLVTAAIKACPTNVKVEIGSMFSKQLVQIVGMAMFASVLSRKDQWLAFRSLESIPVKKRAALAITDADDMQDFLNECDSHLRKTWDNSGILNYRSLLVRRYLRHRRHDDDGHHDDNRVPLFKTFTSVDWQRWPQMCDCVHQDLDEWMNFTYYFSDDDDAEIIYFLTCDDWPWQARLAQRVVMTLHRWGRGRHKLYMALVHWFRRHPECINEFLVAACSLDHAVQAFYALEFHDFLWNHIMDVP